MPRRKVNSPYYNGTSGRKDIEEGTIVILGRDFNEPSHLDWIRETKDLYDPNGLIIPWTVPLLLDNAGFIDTYRTLYPDVLNYPGFTFPADNPLKPVEKLTWAPKSSDERDRIDYVFYYPHPSIKLKKAVIFGPQGSIVKGQRIVEKSKDKFLLPQGVWPTDHKGLLVTFEVDKKELIQLTKPSVSTHETISFNVGNCWFHYTETIGFNV